jgi:hypothetical protein
MAQDNNAGSLEWVIWIRGFGLSAGQIAEKLGVTRKAEIGIVHRAKANRCRAM